jgi:hypothetical protein
VPLLFLVLGLMYSYGHFGLSSLITTIGAVLYLITSTRAVASNITNLIRFFSQSRLHYRLLDAAADAARREQQASRTDEFELWPGNLKLNPVAGREAAQQDPIVVNPGECVILSVEEPISNFSLGALVEPLLKNGILSIRQCAEIAFVGSAYRFGEGTVWENLASRKPDADCDEVKGCCERLNALLSFNALPAQFQTVMNDEVWNALDRHARLALRVVPLVLSGAKLVLIDVSVLQGLRGDAFHRLLGEFANSFIFVTVNAGSAVPEIDGAAYGVIAGGRLVGWGDRDWFVKAHPKKAGQASALTADDEVLQTMLSTG